MKGDKMPRRVSGHAIWIFTGIFLVFGGWSLKVFAQDPSEWDGLIQQFLNADTDEKLSATPYSVLNGVHDGRQLYQFQLGEEWEPSPHTGYTNKKNGKVRQIKRFAGETIYDATYTFDEFHRRINLTPPQEKHRRFAALFGGSFAYGNTVNDDETIHHYMNNFSNEVYTYNYAIGASGPHMMLALLRNTDLKSQIPFEQGHFIYVFLDFHIERANGFAYERRWLRDTPVYEKKNGEMHRLGSFAEAEPIWTQFLYYVSRLFEELEIHRNFPSRRLSHFIYTCDLIKSSQQEFLKQFPTSKFSVYTHPSTYIERELDECLQKANVNVLAVDENINKDWESMMVPYDGHPKAEFNELIAKDLLRQIE